MGLNLRIYIKHDFYELDNYGKSMKFVHDTMNRIKPLLHIVDDDVFGLDCSFDTYDNRSIISFDVPLHDEIVTVELRKGYWCLWTKYWYWWVINKIDGKIPVADITFQMMQMLNSGDAWFTDDIMDEYNVLIPIEEVLEVAKKEHGIAEYPYEDLMAKEYLPHNTLLPWEYIHYKPFYHVSLPQNTH